MNIIPDGNGGFLDAEEIVKIINKNPYYKVTEDDLKRLFGERTRVGNNQPIGTKISILGTEYTIVVKKYDDEPYFKKQDANGYCSSTEKEIAICDMSTYPGWEDESEKACETQKKTTLRHEIVHAFLNESGLSSNSNDIVAWARNEEMVDWFALQGPKIYAAWQEAGAL